MNVELISEDASVLALCRDIARENSKTAWNFAVREESSGASDADLCLWDYKPGRRIPADVRWGTRCFVLVASSDLPEFRASHSYAERGIVLKPITHAVLRSVITQRIPKSTLGPSNGAQLRSDRDELLECLLHANLQLQEFEANRSNFLGRALHDFHAPLSALSGYCGLLLEERPGGLTQQQRLILGRMQRSVRRLSRMSKAMFQLSVGRHIVVKPVLRERDIRECIEQALSEIQQLADEKHLEIDVELGTPSVPLFIDSGQIEQVMVNLLENACKFSPRHGSILVKGWSCFCERRANNVFCAPHSERRQRDHRPVNAYRIEITDSGPGVASDQLKSIFEEYVSYAGGQDRSRGGLGLAICRMIVHQHQGRIWAENHEHGAVFSFVLPLERPENACELSNFACGSGERKSVA